jgi:glycosyltransferase involved in cell wall biosynthesis
VVVFGPDSVHTHRWCVYLEQQGWEVKFIAYGRSIDVTAEAEVPVVRLELGGRLAASRTLLDLIRHSITLRRLLRRMEPDMVQTLWFLGPAWLAAIAAPVPVVATAWGSDVLRPLPRWRTSRLLTRLLSRRLAAVTYSSDALKEGLLAAGVPEDKLHRVVQHPDPTRYRPGPADHQLLARLGVAAGARVILSPRGIAPVYAPETVLDAFSQLPESAGAVLLVRVPAGEDDGWASLLKRVPEAVAGRIISYPGVPPDEFPRLLNSSEVVLSMSRSEGASVTVMETLLCERPLVVSDIPQNREWLSSHEFAWLVPLDDPDALAGAVGAVLADPSAARAKARAARDAVDLHDGMDPLVQLYDRLRTNGRRRRPPS